MRKWAKRIGVGMLCVFGVLAGLGWYVWTLPWRNACGEPLPPAPTVATNAAVATSQPLATQAAADALTDGGNAVDAAIAASLMLAVVEPGNSGLGGGGFALVYDPKQKQSLALDFRERAPLGLVLEELKAAVKERPKALRDGPLAVAVPSEWQGLTELHRRYARLPMSRLARPAIEAARRGIAVGTEYAARCWFRSSVLRSDPEARRTFMTSAGLCPLPGWILHQPALAETLQALTRDDQPRSWDELVGAPMVSFLAQKGSTIAARDLAAVRVVERPTVSGHFLGKRIVSMGPPSSGGIIVITLLEVYERLRLRLPHANRLHLWAEASRLAFYDRATLLGDPDFVPTPVAKLLSDEYLSAQAARVTEADPVDLPKDASLREGSHTTHLTVIDKDGLTIALTQTINVPFGAGLVVPGTGVLLNDEMDDFYLAGPNAFGLVGNALNEPAPGRCPLSSMSPTLVFDGDRLIMALGSPGGSSIPSAVAWVIREALEDHLSGEEAVRSPRIHHQWLPDVLQAEPGFDRSTLPADLRAHATKPQFPIGRVQMVYADGLGWRAASDCRDQGRPWAGSL